MPPAARLRRIVTGRGGAKERAIEDGRGRERDGVKGTEGKRERERESDRGRDKEGPKEGEERRERRGRVRAEMKIRGGSRGEKIGGPLIVY